MLDSFNELELAFGSNTTPTGDIIPISVSLTGFVENPGVYQMTPVETVFPTFYCLIKQQRWSALKKHRFYGKKVLEVPKPAELLSPPTPEKEKEEIITLENNQGLRLRIRITRAGKNRDLRFVEILPLFGDISQNPLLKDGDVVFVPAIQGFYFNWRRHKSAWRIEFVEGDKLGTIIDLSLGFTFDADISKVQLYRYKENRIDYDVLNYDL